MDGTLHQTVSLVRKAQGGDRQAMEDLFARYLPRVRQIVALRLGMAPSAFGQHEDLVQDSLLKTFQNLDKYEPRSDATFRNWIAHCVTNSIRDHFRRSQADKRGGGKVRSFGSFESEDLSVIVFEGKSPTPSAIVGQREILANIEKTLLEMKEHWREVILMRLFCEMSYDEIGEELGIREEATVRKLFSRALADLKKRCE